MNVYDQSQILETDEQYNNELVLNWWLFSPSTARKDITPIFGMTEKSKIAKISISSIVEYHERYIFSILLEYKADKRLVTLPFYISSGRSNAEKTPKGKLLPFGGILFGEKALEKANTPVWFVKSYYSPLESAWKSHHKDTSNLPAPLVKIMNDLISYLNEEVLPNEGVYVDVQ